MKMFAIALVSVILSLPCLQFIWQHSREACKVHILQQHVDSYGFVADCGYLNGLLVVVEMIHDRAASKKKKHFGTRDTVPIWVPQ